MCLHIQYSTLENNSLHNAFKIGSLHNAFKIGLLKAEVHLYLHKIIS